MPRKPAAPAVDTLKQWTVKGVPDRVSDEIVAEARRTSLTAGQLIERMWAAWQAGGSPVVTEAPVDLAAVCDLVRVAVDVQKVTGGKMPKTLQGRLLGLVDQQIRAARGMPALKPRAGQKQIANGSGAA